MDDKQREALKTKKDAVRALVSYAVIHRRNRDVHKLSEVRLHGLLKNIRAVLEGIPGRACARISIIQVLGGGPLTRSEIEMALPFSSRTIEKGLSGTTWMQDDKTDESGKKSKKSIDKEFALVPDYVYSFRDGHKVCYGLTGKGGKVLSFLESHAFDYLHLEGGEPAASMALRNRREFARLLISRGPTSLSDFPEFERYLIERFGWAAMREVK